MVFSGTDLPSYTKGLFIAYAVIAGLLFFVQIIFLQKLRLLPVVLLPLLSFCICFENSMLFEENLDLTHSISARACYFFHSLEIPLFIVILYELTYRVHQARLAHFCCIPFDQGADIANTPGRISLWVVRVIAAGLFVMNMLADFSFESDKNDMDVGQGGYATLAKHRNKRNLWLSLIPPMVLSLIGFFIGIANYRYGKNLTMTLVNNWRWGLVLVTVVGQAVSQCFGRNVYAVTSNAGEVFLLMGASWLVMLVQEDLIIAGSFADFLHRSNLAFSHVDSPSGGTQHASQQHHREKSNTVSGNAYSFFTNSNSNNNNNNNNDTSNTPNNTTNEGTTGGKQVNWGDVEMTSTPTHTYLNNNDDDADGDDRDGNSNSNSNSNNNKKSVTTGGSVQLHQPVHHLTYSGDTTAV